MSSGEADRLGVLSLDKWVCCEVDGCFTKILPTSTRCHEHGGDSPAEIPYDPEGREGITLTDPSAFVWEQD